MTSTTNGNGHALVKRTEQTTIARPTEDAPMSFDQMLSMGEKLVSTRFLPEHIKTGAQAAAIILTGRELGMPPMRAIRSLKMIKGQVVEDASSQLARFKEDAGRSTFRHARCGFKGCKAPKDPKTGIAEHLDEEHASIHLVHRNGDDHVETFTVADAKDAGLLGNPTWQKFKKAMLRSRAITAGLKSIGWEGAVGAYDPDEAQHFDGSRPRHVEPEQHVDDVIDAEHHVEEPKPASKRTADPVMVQHFAHLASCRSEAELHAAIDAWAATKAKLDRRRSGIVTAYEGQRAHEISGAAWEPNVTQKKDLASWVAVFIERDVDVLTGRPVAPPEGDDTANDEPGDDDSSNP